MKIEVEQSYHPVMGRGISKGVDLMIPKENVTNVRDEFESVVSVKGGWLGGFLRECDSGINVLCADLFSMV